MHGVAHLMVVGHRRGTSGDLETVGRILPVRSRLKSVGPFSQCVSLQSPAAIGRRKLVGLGLMLPRTQVAIEHARVKRSRKGRNSELNPDFPRVKPWMMRTEAEDPLSGRLGWLSQAMLVVRSTRKSGIVTTLSFSRIWFANLCQVSPRIFADRANSAHNVIGFNGL